MVAELLASLHPPGGEESQTGDQTVRPDRNHDQVWITGMVEIAAYVTYHYDLVLVLTLPHCIIFYVTGGIYKCFTDQGGPRVFPHDHDVITEVELELAPPPGPGLLLSYHLPGVLTDKLALLEVPGREDAPALGLHLEDSQVSAGSGLDQSVVTAGRLTGAVVIALQDRMGTAGTDQPGVTVRLTARHHQVTTTVPTPPCQAGTAGWTLLEQTPELRDFTFVSQTSVHLIPITASSRDVTGTVHQVWAGVTVGVHHDLGSEIILLWSSLFIIDVNTQWGIINLNTPSTKTIYILEHIVGKYY